MDISIIIVNYNVKYFLKQALASVARALEGLEGEVFVVDNNSQDDSCDMVRRDFPWVQLIENKENVGFAKANNQAIAQAAGEYVLLLNPDTVLEENTLHRCIDFMRKHPEVGGLGVKMIDGSGKYLPESKRGFPSPSASFFKLSGVYSLFPKSKLFNQYYLGHLSKDENHEVDVLAGAFMLMPKNVLDEIGYLDESFFMYGEDIDLSYRIQKAGYKNYYLADTKIIHYKGESTRRDSVKYVRVFYQAMIIFSKKHFEGSKAKLFVFLLNLAIIFKTGITVLKNLARRLFFPLMDGILFFFALYFAKTFWATYHFHNPDYYPSSFMRVNAPVYVFIWLLSIFLTGGYDKVYDLRKLAKGIFFGTLGIAALYGFLEMEYRTSRAIILIGAAMVAGVAFLFRLIAHFIQYGHTAIGKSQPERLVIVGREKEADRALNLMLRTGVEKNFIGKVAPGPTTAEGDYLADLENLDKVVRIYGIKEIVFCSRDVSSSRIMHWMGLLGSDIRYKILPQDSMSIIGSSSKKTRGELYVEEIKFALADPTQRRNKRMLDAALAVLFLLLSPVLIFFIKRKWGFLRNIFLVFTGKKTWVGYFLPADAAYPALATGVLNPVALSSDITDEPTRQRLNFLYAKNYSPGMDVEIILKNIKLLGG